MIRAAVTLMGLIAALVTSAPASAQMNVFVSVTAEDPVGSRLAYAIREGIRRSTAMTLVDRSQDGFITVSLVTLDPDKNENPGSRTIYSVVWTTKTLHATPVSMYLTNQVGLCGTNRVTSCADGIVAETDTKASEVRGWIKDAVEAVKR